MDAAAQGSTQPFKVRYKVPLGGGKAEEVNVPYVATIGPETSTSQSHVSILLSTFQRHQAVSLLYKHECQCQSADIKATQDVQIPMILRRRQPLTRQKLLRLLAQAKVVEELSEAGS